MGQKTLLEYWLAVYSRKGMILLITVSAMITAGVLSKLVPPVYEARAVFFVPKASDSTTFFSSPSGSMVRSVLSPVTKEDDQGPYVGVLKSKALAELVQKEFPHKSVHDLTHRDLDWVVTDEFLIEVYARDRNPKFAAGIANAYVKYFDQLMAGYSLSPGSNIQATIKEQLASTNARLAEAQEALRRFQEENKTANLDEEIRQVISVKTSFESQLQAGRVTYNENVKKIAATQRELRKEKGVFKQSEVVMSSPLLEKLKGQMADLEAQMAALRVEKKEAHPEFVALRKNYDKVNENLRREVERIVNSQVQASNVFYEDLRRQLVTLLVENEKIAASMQAIRQVLKGLEERVVKIPRLKKEQDNLTLEIDRYKKLVETLTTNMEETMAQTKRSPQVAVLVDSATPPSDPSFPIMSLNVIVALIIGFVAGVFYAFFVDYLEATKDKRLFHLVRAIEATER